MLNYDRRILSMPFELREAKSDGSIGTLVRKAIVFDVESEDLGGFTETIAPDSLDQALIDFPDIRSFWNHDTGALLGRTTVGTLRLNLQPDALWYEVDLPDTEDGRKVRFLAKRGDLRESSFGFDTAVGGDEWSRRDNGKRARRVTRMSRLHEVSPVSIPAYPQTAHALRSMERWEQDPTSGLVAPKNHRTLIRAR